MWLFNYDKFYDAYYLRRELSNGQYAMISFYYDDESSKKIKTYNVGFAVGNKKKDVKTYLFSEDYAKIRYKSTGTCGLEAFAWARDMIRTFEKEERGKFRIMVRGDDSRRYHAYKRFLLKEGYREARDSWGRVLFKVIDNKRKYE